MKAPIPQACRRSSGPWWESPWGVGAGEGARLLPAQARPGARWNRTGEPPSHQNSTLSCGPDAWERSPPHAESHAGDRDEEHSDPTGINASRTSARGNVACKMFVAMTINAPGTTEDGKTPL